jgi:nucleoside phosphorylase
MTQPTLYIYAALECEAKPFINYFGLTKVNTKHPFSIYKSDTTVLTVSGVGKTAMAAAVAYTQAIIPSSTNPVLINVGIAGHRNHALGNLFLATKITDKDSKKRFYPQLIGGHWPETAEIQTTSTPCTEYSENSIHDMEASAFYEIAVKFSSSELIHSLKIISDNSSSSINTIRPKQVSEWISQHLTQIEQLCEHCLSLQQSILPIELIEFQSIINQWHFTISGEIKLKKLLLRWQNLSPKLWLKANKVVLYKSKDVLRKLEEDVDALDIIYD